MRTRKYWLRRSPAAPAPASWSPCFCCGDATTAVPASDGAAVMMRALGLSVCHTCDQQGFLNGDAAVESGRTFLLKDGIGFDSSRRRRRCTLSRKPTVASRILARPVLLSGRRHRGGCGGGGGRSGGGGGGGSVSHCVPRLFLVVLLWQELAQQLILSRPAYTGPAAITRGQPAE